MRPVAQVDIMEISSQGIFMASAAQLPFRYRDTDGPNGVSRDTARRLVETLGMDETAVIHKALHDLAVKTLPQYEPDNGPLTPAQLRKIRAKVVQDRPRHIASSLFVIPGKTTAAKAAKRVRT